MAHCEITGKPITLAQKIAESEIKIARAAGTFLQMPNAWDPACAGTSEWLYDQPGNNGNRICFDHPLNNFATHDLAQFTRGTALVCGVIVTLRWAGGPIGCNPVTGGLLFASNNTNFVRSIWTGESTATSAGVFFSQRQS